MNSNLFGQKRLKGNTALEPLEPSNHLPHLPIHLIGAILSPNPPFGTPFSLSMTPWGCVPFLVRARVFRKQSYSILLIRGHFWTLFWKGPFRSFSVGIRAQDHRKRTREVQRSNSALTNPKIVVCSYVSWPVFVWAIRGAKQGQHSNQELRTGEISATPTLSGILDGYRNGSSSRIDLALSQGQFSNRNA